MIVPGVKKTKQRALSYRTAGVKGHTIKGTISNNPDAGKMEEIKRLKTSLTMQIIKGKLYLKLNDAESGNIIKDMGKRVALKCRHRNEKAEAQSK